MGIKVTKQGKEKNWVLPGEKITHKEFIQGIKKAEKGPFYSIEEAKVHLSKWKKERGL